MKPRNLLIGVILVLLISIMYYLFVCFSFQKISDRGIFGDMFGGLNTMFSGLALVGIIYTIYFQQIELKLQRDELANTREVFRKQKFEHTFFSLLANQNKILEGIVHEINIPQKEYKKEIKGRDFFNHIKGYLKVVYEIVNSDNHKHEEIINKFGGDKSDYYGDRYEDYRSKIDEFKINIEDKSKEEIAIFCENIIFFSYRYKYSHYFKHVYRILKLIDENEENELTEEKDEKIRKEIQNRYKNYSKILQAQMSNPEMTIMFYNSLKYKKTMRLINKYEFLENLPKELLLSLEHTNLYKFDFNSEYKYIQSNR